MKAPKGGSQVLNN